MMNKSVYIIILNWNGKDDTIECLKSIRKNNYTNYTIVLVDNGSENENREELKTWCRDTFSQFVLYTREQAENGGVSNSEELIKKTISEDKIVFIDNNENLGFAAGNNVALKYTLKVNADFSFLLNNDTVIEPDSIEKLMIFLEDNPSYVAVTPQIRYFEPNDVIWNCGGKILWFGTRRYYYAMKNISEVPQKGFKNITYITGCALLFKPQVTGILTEKFFFGEEDLDFSFRQKISNRKMACVFDSVIFHKVGASANKIRGHNPLGHIYLNYLMRLLDNKQYTNKFMFNVKLIIILGYAIPMIRIRYKIGFKTIFRMVNHLLKELRIIDKVDKEYSLRYLNVNFKN